MASKKGGAVPSVAASAEPTLAAVGAGCPTAAPLDALTVEALRRFDPFVFTFATDTKDVVDVGPCMDVVARDPNVAENYFLIDRQEAVNAFCALSADMVLPPYQGQVYADVKAMQGVLADTSDGASVLTAHQSFLVAACVHQKLSTFAVAREKRRLAVLEAAHQAHLDLVEKFLDDGMAPEEAERAAEAEEEAVRVAEAAELAAGGDAAEGEERPQAFVCLKCFPQTALDIVSLGKVGITVASILTVNSNARLGIRKDDAAKAAAAAAATAAAAGGKGAKAPAAAEAKKVDPKKAPAGGKKGEDAGGAPPVTESVSALLRKELCKMPAFTTQHPFLDIALWDYTAPTVPSTTTTNSDESGGTNKSYDLAESEMNIFNTIASRVVALELARHQFQAWRRNVVEVVVPPLVLHDAAKEEADAQAAAAAAAAREKAEALAKTAGGKKAAAAPPPKGAKGTAGLDPAGEAGSSRDAELSSLVPPTPAPLPPLPTDMTKLRLPTVVPDGGRSTQRRPDDGSLACQLLDVVDAAACAATYSREEQQPSSHRASCAGLDTGSPQLSPRTQANELLEKAVRQAKEDVSDYADYILGILDGTQLEVCAAIRNRRRLAAEGASRAGDTPLGGGAGGDVAKQVQLGERSFQICGPPSASPASTGSAADRKTSTDVVAALIAPHHRFVRQAASADDDTDAKGRLIECLTRCDGRLSKDDAEHMLAARSHLIERLTPAELDARLLDLHTAMDTDLLSTRVLQCGDGMDVIACGVASATSKDTASIPQHRSIAFSTAFHGAPTYAQYVQWLDYVEQETLHYHPPPKDEDDDEPDAEASPDEEEEEEEEEPLEEMYDDDGNVMEQPPRKKVKKIVLYDPEYVDVAKKEKAARQRRQVLELFGRILAYQPLLARKQHQGLTTLQADAAAAAVDAWPLAACNHGAHIVHEDVDLMYPKDGCVIAVRTSIGNEAIVSCRVYPPGLPQGSNQFGFERRQASGAPPPPSNHDGAVETRVRTTIVVEGVVAALDIVVETADTQDTAAAGAGPASTETASHQAPVAQAAPLPPAVSGKTPRGGPSKAATAAAVAAPPDAAVGTPTPRQAHPAERKKSLNAPNAPLLHAVLTNWDGVSVRLSSASHVVALVPDACLALGSVVECPSIHVFDGATQSVVRMPVAAELGRSVTDAGVMHVTLVAEAVTTHQRPLQGAPAHRPSPPPSASPTADAAKGSDAVGPRDDATDRIHLQLYPSGTTAAIYKGQCLITRRDGVRIVRPVAPRDGAETPEAAAPRLLSSIGVAAWRDEDALCTTYQREDGVVVRANDADGSQVVVFQDGTSFHVAAAHVGGPSVCRIASPRPYPTVAVSSTVQHPAHREVSIINRAETVVATLACGVSLRLSSLVTGFHAVVPLACPHYLYTLPTPESDAAYVVDMLYGGLRVEDDTWCFHVTPQGDTRARLAADEHAPPPTDLTVKHTIEVFGKGDQGLPSDLCHILEGRFGPDSSLLQPLHTLAHVPRLPSTISEQHVLRPTTALTQRSRRTFADDAKIRATTERLAALLLQSKAEGDGEPPLLTSCRLFVRAADGGGYELLDARDKAATLRAALAQSDLVHSDVVDDTTTGVVTVASASRSAAGNAATHCNVVDNGVQQPPPWTVAPRSVEQFARLMTEGLSRDRTRSQDAPTLTLHAYHRSLSAASLQPSTNTAAVDARWVEQQLQQRLPMAEQAVLATPETPHRLPAVSTANLAQRTAVRDAVTELHDVLQSLQQSNAQWWTYAHATHSDGTLPAAAMRSEVRKQPATTEQQPPTRSNPAEPRANAHEPASVPVTKHVNPTAPAAVPPSSAPAASTSRRSLTAHRLVATPSSVDFGTLMEGFRYTCTVQLTNIATASCRYRVELPSSCAAWLSVDYPKLPIAAGMSVTLTFDVSGHQAPGGADLDVDVVYEGGGRTTIPLSLTTRSSDDRPVSQQRRGVRMVGPSPMVYVSTSPARVATTTEA